MKVVLNKKICKRCRSLHHVKMTEPDGTLICELLPWRRHHITKSLDDDRLWGRRLVFCPNGSAASTEEIPDWCYYKLEHTVMG